MNLNTANLKVGLAASKDETRKNITAVHVTGEYTEATNGHMLARVSLPHQAPAEELPTAIKTLPAYQVTPFLIPAKTALGIKLLKSKMPILNDALYVDIEATNVNGTAHFSATNLETTISPKLQKVDSDFPTITDKVIPTGKPDFQACLNIEYLQTLLTIARSTGAETITLNGYLYKGKPKPFVSLLPLVLDAENKDTVQTFKGVIMPINR